MKKFVFFILLLITLMPEKNLSASNLNKLKQNIVKKSTSKDKKNVEIKSLKKQTSFPNLKWESKTGLSPQSIGAIIASFKIDTKGWMDCSASKAVFIDKNNRIIGSVIMKNMPNDNNPRINGLSYKGKNSFRGYFFYDKYKRKFKKTIVFIGNSEEYSVYYYPKNYTPDPNTLEQSKKAAGL